MREALMQCLVESNSSHSKVHLPYASAGVPHRLNGFAHLQQRILAPKHAAAQAGQARAHLVANSLDHDVDGYDVAPAGITPELADTAAELLEIDCAAVIRVEGVEQVHLVLVGNVKVVEHLHHARIATQQLEDVGRELHPPGTLKYILGIPSSAALALVKRHSLRVDLADNLEQLGHLLGEVHLIPQALPPGDLVFALRHFDDTFDVLRDDNVEKAKRHKD
mmetsp:Transcript_8878/g.25457  ORF Transcript_8878/g.25457 Transcript_8878/m.25457 type:complete len:221 (-) Transcript_8878:26-688(-)